MIAPISTVREHAQRLQTGIAAGLPLPQAAAQLRDELRRQGASPAEIAAVDEAVDALRGPSGIQAVTCITGYQ